MSDRPAPAASAASAFPAAAPVVHAPSAAPAAPAVPAVPAVRLEVLSGEDAGRSVLAAPAPGAAFVLGRVQGCALVVRDERVSRRHAELRPGTDGRLVLHDLDSANGTWVDGERVSERVLIGGERVRVGDVELAVRTDAPTPAVAPPPPTYSMVGRLVDQRTRGARRATHAALAVATLAMGAVGVSAATAGGDDPVPAVVARLAPSTVLIEARHDDRTTTGSGWVLDAGDGLVVTNAHVVNQGVRYRVLADGRARDATLVGSAPCEDIALLRVGDAAGLRTAPLGTSSEVRHGATVVALGYPAGASGSGAMSSTRGVISVPRTVLRDPAPDVPAYADALVTDTALNPGNSGGPLVDLRGQVVGINAAARTAGSDGRRLEGQGFALGIDRVRRVTDALRAGRSQGWTGATFGYPTLEELAERRLPRGLYLTGAVPGTPAARAALGGRGELLQAVDGRPVGTSLAEYCAAVATGATGTRVTLTVVGQDGRTRAVRLPLA